VVHHGEQKLPVVQPKNETGIWHIGAVGLKGQNPRILFFDALEKQANLILLYKVLLKFFQTQFVNLRKHEFALAKKILQMYWSHFEKDLQE
jgi:hypothetical protein